MQHNCAECRYLTRTSPTQVFLLCEFWASHTKSFQGMREAFSYDYIISHCHMQPEATACPFFKAKEKSEKSNGAVDDSRELLHAH